MSAYRPFSIEVPDETLKFIQARVRDYPWHEMPDDGGWDYGTNMDYMKELCDYWATEFDWRKQEAKINQFSHYKALVDDIDMHFIYEKGSGPNPKPLMLSHGWPGTVAEFLDFIDLLAHPEKHGGSVDDAFDVVAPSLPGFGFSGRPPRPYGPRKMAAIFDSLMTDVLGYETYIAQGGDWGGAISSWLGYEHPACAAIHINRGRGDFTRINGWRTSHRRGNYCRYRTWRYRQTLGGQTARVAGFGNQLNPGTRGLPRPRGARAAGGADDPPRSRPPRRRRRGPVRRLPATAGACTQSIPANIWCAATLHPHFLSSIKMKELRGVYIPTSQLFGQCHWKNCLDALAQSLFFIPLHVKLLNH